MPLIGAQLGQVGERWLADSEALALMGPTVNVRHWGARGDGASDDTLRLQYALNITPAGGLVIVPPGVYKTTASLYLRKSVRILGGSLSAIQCVADTPVIIVDGSGNTEPSGSIGAVIEDLDISGGSTSIRFQGPIDPWRTHLLRVRMFDSTFACLEFVSNLLGGRFDQLYFYGSGHGVYAVGSVDPVVPDLLGNTTWTNCNWAGVGAGHYAFYVVEANQFSLMPNVLMLNPEFQGLKGRVLYAKNTRVTMIEPHIEGCCLEEPAGEDIQLEGSMPGTDTTLRVHGGVVYPAYQNRWTRIKMLTGQTRLIIRDTQFSGASSNIIDCDNKPNVYCGFESMGFGGWPTVINAAGIGWRWLNGPVP